MSETENSNQNAGKFAVAAIVAVCGAIFAAAAAIMDPSATRVLMTVAALLFVVGGGVLIGAAVGSARRS